MNDKDRIEEIKKKAKESAKELLEELPEDIENEFRKETTLGNPKNLIRPDNEEE